MASKDPSTKQKDQQNETSFESDNNNQSSSSSSSNNNNNNNSESARDGIDSKGLRDGGKLTKQSAAPIRERDNVSLARAKGRRSGRSRSERPSEDVRSLDWAKFTHFRAGNTVEDLKRLCGGGRESGGRQTRRSNVFNASKPDKAGLWPIHWAAINNRSDMIEFMLASGAQADKRCKNKLFARGTPLHLAAMNGSLEAAAMLISKCDSDSDDSINKAESNETEGSADLPEQTGFDGTRETRSREFREGRDNRSGVMKMLNARDAEGQTPLMRSAPPRSKRMDIVKDLLRKNFWSLSGRPGEMALYLICNGADWRQTEPTNGMNLMHLAIMNDYDDIVSLLLVLDKQLLDVAAGVPQDSNNKAPSGERSSKQQVTDRKSMEARPSIEQKEARDESGFVTIALNESAKKDNYRKKSSLATSYRDDSSSSSSSMTQRKPLISERDKAKDFLAKGLKPLQLAVLYGRVRIISTLWHTKLKNPNQTSSERDRKREEEKIINEFDDGLGRQRRAVEEHSSSSKELKRILIRATWSNRDELAKFLKSTLLKVVLMLDLGLMVLLWAPAFAAPNHGSGGLLSSLKGGLFLFSYCITMAIAFRAMLKNPGYLRRNSVQYLAQLSRLTAITGNEDGGASRAKQTDVGREGAKSPKITIVQPRVQSAAPLIKLSPTSPEQKAPDKGGQVAIKGTLDQDRGRLGDKMPPKRETAASQQRRPSETTAKKLVVLPQAPNWQAQFDLKDSVRLLCHKCQCIRRPRSRHCDHCNHCVQDFDHHCIYLGCCIGRHNRLDFLLALIGLTITSVYGSIIQSSSVAQRSDLRPLFGFLWVFKYALIGVWSSFHNLRRACLGVTLYEEIRSKRIRHLFGRRGPPESISKSHRGLSTLKGSYWRYAPDRFITGELPLKRIWSNYREFANFTSADEYLLTYVCTDTPLARSLNSSDARINLYKIA